MREIEKKRVNKVEVCQRHTWATSPSAQSPAGPPFGRARI
jgi:hypothetical protein